MHKLLAKLLNKRGITKVEDLSIEEKADFDRWNELLIAKEITIENITEFIKDQKSKIEDKIANPELPKEQRLDLLPYLTIYKSLLVLIQSPSVERELVEKTLKQLIQ